KRVWKACERCRMKKTKCDGEFPCKRCKDDGLVCTASTRKKTEYKQVPKGYAELLENTQFALIKTIHKLYSMVRNQQRWDLGEPELNDRGQPAIHNIVSKLGCIGPNSDIDLPVHSIFPEDEAGLQELARQLEGQQLKEAAGGATVQGSESIYCNGTERTSFWQSDYSDFEADCPRNASGNGGRANTLTMISAGLSYPFSMSSTSPSDGFSTQSTSGSILLQTFDSPWSVQPQSAEAQQQQQQQAVPPPPSFFNLLNPGLLESSFGTIKPYMLSCPNPEVMLGIWGPESGQS
ncbi:putative c6 transcription factor protein, partial [Rhypophila decipiens]